MQPISLSIPDMTCGSCVAHIREAIDGVAGVHGCTIDLRQRQVRFQVSDLPTVSTVQARLADDGYPASILAQEGSDRSARNDRDDRTQQAAGVP